MDEQPEARRRSPGGRRRKPVDEVRTVLIGYRGTPAEKAEVRVSAGLSGKSVSQWMREAHALAARGGKPQPSPKTAEGESIEVVRQLRQIGNNVNQIARHANFGTFPPEVGAEAATALREISSYLRWLHYGPEH